MMWTWLAAALFTIAAAAALLFYACSVPSSQVFGRTLVRATRGRKRVALTFDDGPAAPFTEQVLDILSKHGVTATFFVCGKNAERLPAVVRRIRDEGHLLGNHTYSHPSLLFKRHARIEAEIDRTQDVLEQITGCRPAIFRPPYGVRWFGLFPALKARGMRLVQWSDAGFDWVKGNGPQEIATRALRGLADGAILLLHDGRERRLPAAVDASATVQALPLIIDGVWRAGFSFASLEEFLRSDGTE